MSDEKIARAVAEDFHDDMSLREPYEFILDAIKRAKSECDKELAELRTWKAAQMEVESEWDPQKIGNLLGMPLGESIRKNLLPYIQRLVDSARKQP